MVNNTLEERLNQLEAYNKKQEKRIQKLEAVHEIANMMGRYVLLHEVQREPEFYNTMFAKKAPGITYEVANFGLFKGREGLKRALDAHGPQDGKIKPGTMMIHTLCTPVIEIAGDGKTARGVWTSPGAGAIRDPQSGNVTGCWEWSKYGVDFVKEDNKWKIWHYHVYRIFRTPADKNFSDEYELKVLEPAIKASGGKGIPHMDPDTPPTYDNPFRKDYIPELVPAPPEPYETWDPKNTYGPPVE